jgi:hypothetical protein
MIHLIYICSAAITPSEQDLIALLSQARCRNRSLGITGMLLYDNNTYIQVIEGEERDVHRIFNSIQNDSRVERLITLVEEEIECRDFPDWTMGFRNLKSHTTKLSGFTEIFSGKVDPSIAEAKQVLAVDLLMSFAKESESLRPISVA